MNGLKDLNPEQQQAVTYGDGPLLIVAGAGTGKTTVITRRLAWLIEQGLAKPQEILALTFTDKAAGEMEERVDKLLPYGYVDLWVMTFHAFGDRILRQHGLDIGLPNDFKLLTPTEAWLLVRQNLDKFNLDYYRPLGNPTKFIHALLKHFSRCKDEVISPEDYLKYAGDLKLNNDSAPESVILSPSTLLKVNSAKNLLNKARDPSLLSVAQDDIGRDEINRLIEIANAFHVYNQLLLDNNALDFGDLINYTLKLFQTRPQILEKYRQQFKYILVDEFQDTNWAQYELIKLLAAPSNNLTVVGDDDQAIYKFRGASVSNILHFKKDFPQAKEAILIKNFRSKQNILDLSYRLIKNNDPERLETKLNINKKLLADREGEGLIERIHARTAEEEARLVAKKIVEIYNAMNEKTVETSQQLPGGLENVIPAQAGIQKTNSNISELDSRLRGNDIGRTASTASSWNDFAILLRANSQAEMFMAALDQAGLPYQFLASTGLYRQPIVMDILAYLRLLDNYHENTAAYRVLNLSIWKLPAEDLIYLNHWAKKKAWSLYETLKQAPTLPLKPESLKTIEQILNLVAKHTALAREQSVGRLILSFLTDSGYLRYLTEREEHGESGAVKQIFYLKKFFDTISQFEQSQTEKLVKHYLAELNYILESGEEGSLAGAFDEGPEAVKIMTVHGAKGLEFRYVFLVNLVDLKFPSTDRKEAIEIPEALIKEIIPEGDIHLQEERRLFYVGLTRARDGIFFTSADDYGGTRKRKPSRFLYEIGMEKKAPLPCHPERSEGSNPKNKEIKEIKEIKDNKYSILNIKYSDSSTPKSLTISQLPRHFSYTQLKAFTTCPLQYKFSHLLQIPIKGKATFSFGKTMHGTLQKFYQRMIDLNSQQQNDLFSATTSLNHLNTLTLKHSNTQTQQPSNHLPPKADPPWAGTIKPSTKTPSLDDLLSFYESSWIDDWYEDKKQKQDYYEKGKQILKDFYELNQSRWTIPKYLESGFHLKIGEYILKGQIDRIDSLADGAIELIDYKTGRPKSAEKITLEDKEQLLIYQMAAEQSLREKPSLLSFYYLDNNQKVSFLGTAEEIAKMKENIVQIIEQMKTSNFPAKPSEHTCRYCDFKEICESAEI